MVAMPWLGEFHKLGNHHLGLKKRYEAIHIKEHARQFLDDATLNRLDKFLRMDDFDLTNKFFLHDEIAGLTELQIAVKRFLKEKQACSSALEGDLNKSTCELGFQFTEGMADSVDGLLKFCSEYGKVFPIIKIMVKYLFVDNMCTLAYLESQKFGNLSLNEATQKRAVPFNFTTKAVHYGPDYVGHIRNIVLARPHEKVASKFIWTENRREESGHRRPHD